MTEDELKEVQTSALRMIAASSKSKKDLTTKLERKGYSEETIKIVIQKLEDSKLVDDYRYAKDLVIHWTRIKPAGLGKIRFELKRKGIPAKIIETVLDQNEEVLDERPRARELAERRFEKALKLTTEKRQKKVYDFLVRRGFDFSLSRDIIRELEQELSHDDC